MILLKEVRLAGESTDVLVGGGKILGDWFLCRR